VTGLVFPSFRPRFPWLGGDLQTGRNWLCRGTWPDLSRWPEERLRVPMTDGSGDVLLAALNRPESESGRPLVVLIHGLTGSEASAYMLFAAALWLGLGHSVLRLNLRGAGPSATTCRGRYHAGRSEDLRMALAALPPAIVAPGILVVGYSLGGNLLLKYLGETGAAAPVRAAAVVSAPIDLSRTAAFMLRPRNRIYGRWFARSLRRDALAHGDLDPRERAAVRAAHSVHAFDDALVAPRNGFRDAEDYYTKCGGQRFLSAIRVPTLVIHAPNDPWIPIAPFRAVNWRGNAALRPLLEARGGHVGFHGRGSLIPWHDRCIVRFFARMAGAASLEPEGGLSRP